MPAKLPGAAPAAFPSDAAPAAPLTGVDLQSFSEARKQGKAVPGAYSGIPPPSARDGDKASARYVQRSA